MKPIERTWVVDSMEENSAAVEQDGSTVYQIPRFLLPAGVREGDVCRVSAPAGSAPHGITVTIELDEKATQIAKDRSSLQLASMPKSKDPGGPINL